MSSRGIHPVQLRDLVIRPTLVELGMEGLAAEVLLLGTAMVESGIRYLKQHPRGPALGIYQMEPRSHDDLWEWVQRRQPSVTARWAPGLAGHPPATRMIGDLYYATTMARLFYRRVPAALPAADDAEGLAQYHKRYWNTYLGATNLDWSIPIFTDAISLLEN